MTKKLASSAKRRKKSQSSSTSKKRGTTSAKKTKAKKPTKKTSRKGSKAPTKAKKKKPTPKPSKTSTTPTPRPRKSKPTPRPAPKRKSPKPPTKRAQKLRPTPKRKASKAKASKTSKRPKKETQAQKVKRLELELASTRKALEDAQRESRATARVRPVAPVAKPSGVTVPPKRELEREPAAVIRLVPRPREPLRSRGRVYVVRASEPSAYAEKGQGPQDASRARISGKGNTREGDFESAFLAAFLAKLKKTGLQDPSDAPMWRYGVSIRVESFEDRDKTAAALQVWLNKHLPDKHHSAHIVLEDDALNIKLNFGRSDEVTEVEDAYNDLIDQEKFIKRVFRKLRAYSGDDDFIWFPHWDWPEGLERDT